jgi:hypothetical protein
VDRILARAEVRSLEEIGTEQLEILIGLGTAIRDGFSTIESAFPPLAPEAKPAALFARSEASNASRGTEKGGEDRTAQFGPPRQEVSQTKPKIVTAEAAAATDPTPATEAPSLMGLHKQLADFLSDAGISFSDFAGWLRTTGRAIEADSWPGVETIPVETIETLLKDAKGMHKLITLYGNEQRRE